MERIMLDVMYELPQTENVAKVVINRGVVEGRGKPKMKFRKPGEADKASQDDEDSDSANAA
jgi:ATP-dependent protease Clp ATPase subunit